MAITLKSFDIDAGITLENPVFIVSELYLHQGRSVDERLVLLTDDEGVSAYELSTNEHANNTVTYAVSVFASAEAFNAGKPPVTQIHSAGLPGNGFTFDYAFDYKDEQYSGHTLRDAAYTHLLAQPLFTAAEKVTGIDF
ncbi:MULTISPECIES: hypothetical protein [Shewanella]|uniref:hypothetical protein n=1 Tax=Shewanella TaxID=22 RepID=UPI003005983D